MLCKRMHLDLQVGVGRLRTDDVWIGHLGSTLADAEYVPPDPQQLVPLLEQLMTVWNASFDSVRQSGQSSSLRSIAEFHARLLSIHPFLDGNGRVARALIVQQCIDLLGDVDPSLLDRGGAYVDAIREASDGKPSSLAALVARMLPRP